MEIMEFLWTVFQVYFGIDCSILIYVWTWKEWHYHYTLLYFPIPFTGFPVLIWLLRHGGIEAGLKEMFGEYEKIGGLLS